MQEDSLVGRAHARREGADITVVDLDQLLDLGAAERSREPGRALEGVEGHVLVRAFAYRDLVARGADAPRQHPHGIRDVVVVVPAIELGLVTGLHRGPHAQHMFREHVGALTRAQRCWPECRALAPHWRRAAAPRTRRRAAMSGARGRRTGADSAG